MGAEIVPKVHRRRLADVTPPTTSHTLSPATPNGQGGYYTSPVNVTLTATDEQGGSGIDKTEYRIGSGAFQTYSAPIAVATDGNHSIEYRSVDKNGNVEATKSVAGWLPRRSSPGIPMRRSVWAPVV